MATEKSQRPSAKNKTAGILTKPVIHPEVGSEVPDEHVGPAKFLT